MAPAWIEEPFFLTGVYGAALFIMVTLGHRAFAQFFFIWCAVPDSWYKAFNNAFYIDLLTSWHSMGCFFASIISFFATQDSWPTSVKKEVAIGTGILYTVWSIQNFVYPFLLSRNKLHRYDFLMHGFPTGLTFLCGLWNFLYAAGATSDVVGYIFVSWYFLVFALTIADVIRKTWNGYFKANLRCGGTPAEWYGETETTEKQTAQAGKQSSEKKVEKEKDDAERSED